MDATLHRPRLGARSAWWVALLLVTSIGCDLDSLLQAPHPERCHEAGAQCRLETGPLGVCERSACAAGAEAPCFQCTPQH